MALPGDINTITVTGKYLTPAGNAMSGTVTFTPSTPVLVDTVGSVLLGGVGVTVALDGSGAFSVLLPCTGQLTPGNWSWTVTETIGGLPPRSYSVSVPHSLGGTVDISTLTPIVPSAIVVSTPSWVSVKTYGATGDGVTDDTAAIKSALAAAPANGGTVYFPTGSYRITSTLSVAVTGTRLVGDGWGSRILFDGASVTAAVNASSVIRVFVQDMRFSQSNASNVGTAIDMSNFSGGTVERVLIDNSGSGVPPLTGISMSGGSCHYNEVRSCRISYGGAGSAGVALTAAAHSNTVIDCRFVPTADDAASSGVYIANTHSTTLIHPDVELGAGNGIWLDTAADGTTVINAYCEQNNIGLKITSGVNAPTVIGGTYQTSVTANVQNNGAVNPVFQNLWPNSGATTSNHLEFGNVDKFTINGLQMPSAAFQPSEQNLLAWSYEPAAATASSALSTSGVLHLIRVNLRYAATVSTVRYQVNAAGATLTSGQNFVGVYDSAGNLKATSADQATNWTGTGAMATALTVPFAATAGAYYVAFVVNGTTGPALERGNGGAGAGSTINAGLTAANYRFALNGTGNTTLPSTFTPASNTQESVPYWVAIS